MRYDDLVWYYKELLVEQGRRETGVNVNWQALYYFTGTVFFVVFSFLGLQKIF